MGAHVAKGATLVHDRERAHNVLVRENDLVDESYKADVRDPRLPGGDGAREQPLLLDQALPLALHGHGSRQPAIYLNLYVYHFRVKRDDERWPKIARVVRHLLMVDARFPQLDVGGPSPKF